MTRENQANQPNGQSQAAGERKLIEDRLAKTAEIRSRGLDPYPPRFNRTHTTVEAVALFQSLEEGDREADCGTHIVRVAGRASRFVLREITRLLLRTSVSNSWSERCRTIQTDQEVPLRCSPGVVILV